MTSKYPQIDFYDISCLTTQESWSPFAARTYLALRLLDIPFQRHLVPMAHIDSTLTSLGAPPTTSERRTLPAITITTPGKKEWITDSKDIAEKFQDLYTSTAHPLSTSLFPDTHSRSCIDLVRQCFKSSLYTEDRWKSVTPAIYKILEPESSDYFVTTRTADWGKHPQEILDTDAAQNEARAGGVHQLYAQIIQPFAQLYDGKETKEGVWLGGERPIYADLMTLALLQWFKCANQDAFEQGLKINGGVLEKAWIAGQPLFK